MPATTGKAPTQTTGRPLPALSNGDFKIVLENQADLVIVTTLDGAIEYCNPAMERILGWVPDQVIGRNAFEYLHPDDAVGLFDIFLEIVKTPGTTRKGEGRYRHANGTWRMMEGQGRSALGSDGAIRIISTSRDITEKRKAEAFLQDSAEMFRNIFEEGPLAMAVTDPQYRLLHVNARFCGMTGYTAGELSHMGFADLTHPDDVADSVEKSRMLFDGPETFSRMEKRCVRKDGSILRARVTASLVRDPDGRPLYSLAVMEDMGDQR